MENSLLLYITIFGVFFSLYTVKLFFSTTIKGLFPIICSLVLFAGGVLYFAFFSGFFFGNPYRMYVESTSTGDELTEDVFFLIIGYGLFISGAIALISGILQIILGGMSLATLASIVVPILFSTTTTTRNSPMSSMIRTGNPWLDIILIMLIFIFIVWVLFKLFTSALLMTPFLSFARYR